MRERRSYLFVVLVLLLCASAGSSSALAQVHRVFLDGQDFRLQTSDIPVDPDTVFSSMDYFSSYHAYAPGNGIIGVEDYRMDLARLGLSEGTKVVEVEALRFIGGIKSTVDGDAGVVMSFEFADSEGQVVSTFDLNVPLIGNVIWIVDTPGLIVPSIGTMAVRIDPFHPDNIGRNPKGQWFMVSEDAVDNYVGWSPDNPYGIPEDGTAPRVFSFGLHGMPDVLLPVELTSFEGVAEGQDVSLTWSTASEKDHSGFSVEHRRESGDFQAVGFVPGSGDSDSRRDYTFSAPQLDFGRHYFRLRHEALDGSSTYSKTIEIVVPLDVQYQMTDVYPNPMQSVGETEFLVSSDQSVTVSVANLLGQTVHTAFRGRVEANRSVRARLDLGTMPSGPYVVVVEGETFKSTRSFVLVR